MPKWIIPILVILGLFASYFNMQRESAPDFVDQNAVFAKVTAECLPASLHAPFVVGIVRAESAYDANARNGKYRGIMQLSRPVWETYSDEPFSKVYDWELNIEVGVAYLNHLKGMLRKEEKFSYPRLAAAYLHGYNALQEAGFDIKKLPPTENVIYAKLFAGELAPVYFKKPDSNALAVKNTDEAAVQAEK